MHEVVFNDGGHSLPGTLLTGCQETPQRKKPGVMRTLTSLWTQGQLDLNLDSYRSFLDYATGFDGYQLCGSRTDVFSGSFYTWTSSWSTCPEVKGAPVWFSSNTSSSSPRRESVSKYSRFRGQNLTSNSCSGANLFRMTDYSSDQESFQDKWRENYSVYERKAFKYIFMSIRV